MTRPAERNAFEAALVPAHHRVRALLEHHPHGPPPSEAIKAIREAIAPSDARDIGDRLQASDQAKTELCAAIHAASAFTFENLQALAGRVRSLPTLGRIVPADLDLPPEQLRLLAAHLIHTGVTATEVSLGAILIAGEAGDADREPLRRIALLGGGLGWKAKLALAGPHLGGDPSAPHARHGRLPRDRVDHHRSPRALPRDRRTRPAHRPETAHLIAALFLTVQHTAAHLFAWSRWRSRKNKQAKRSHYRRRGHPEP